MNERIDTFIWVMCLVGAMHVFNWIYEQIGRKNVYWIKYYLIGCLVFNSVLCGVTGETKLFELPFLLLFITIINCFRISFMHKEIRTNAILQLMNRKSKQFGQLNWYSNPMEFTYTETNQLCKKLEKIFWELSFESEQKEYALVFWIKRREEQYKIYLMGELLSKDQRGKRVLEGKLRQIEKKYDCVILLDSDQIDIAV